MPDLLLLSLDTKSFFELEQLGNELGFRVKTTTELDTAKEWLHLKQFDVVLADAQLEISDWQQLATLLWRRSPQAAVVLFSFSEKPDYLKNEARLFGVDAAFGAGAQDVVRSVLRAAKESGASAGSGHRVLVVEDLDSPRDIICFYLESLGFSEVVGVRSAKAAIEELEKDPRHFDCVITDIRMPEVSGRDLIEFVRRHERLRHIPMVALTAYGTVDTLIECLKAGASGFLVKPPKRDDLTREVARAIRISARGGSPRLANEQEAELLRELLIEKGFS
jgi:CheY-like chemotaxis protein